MSMSIGRRALTYALGTIALGYLGIGFGCLVFDTRFSYPIDLRLRWIEEKLVVSGIDPQAAGHTEAELPDTHKGMKNLGGGYPPWSYATGIVLYPPIPWNALRWYFAGECAIAFGLIVWWVRRIDPGRSTENGLLYVVSIGAMFPIAICVSYGQYTVIAAACLALSLLALERGRDACAGIFLGIALAKPHTAGLFLLVLLIRGRFKALAFAAGYLIVASCIVWALVGNDPLTLFNNAAKEAATSSTAAIYQSVSVNPFTAPLSDALGPKVSTLVLAASGTLATIILLIICRRIGAPLLIDYSVCAVVSMYWSYRKNYDAVLLFLPLVALLCICLRTRSKISWVMFALFGLTVWLPIRDEQWQWPIIQYSDLVIWLLGLASMIWHVRTNVEGPSDPKPLSAPLPTQRPAGRATS